MKFASMHEYKGFYIEPAGGKTNCIISDYRQRWARFMGIEKKWHNHYNKVTPFKTELQAYKIVDTL